MTTLLSGGKAITVLWNTEIFWITEILFIERCLELLKPGVRMGIVLPEGIYNNPFLAHVREFMEDRAFLKAVVSLPQETFVSSGALPICGIWLRFTGSGATVR